MKSVNAIKQKKRRPEGYEIIIHFWEEKSVKTLKVFSKEEIPFDEFYESADKNLLKIVHDFELEKRYKEDTEDYFRDFD